MAEWRQVHQPSQRVQRLEVSQPCHCRGKMLKKSAKTNRPPMPATPIHRKVWINGSELKNDPTRARPQSVPKSKTAKSRQRPKAARTESPVASASCQANMP